MAQKNERRLDQQQTDHDLLTRLDEKVSLLVTDVKEIKENQATRLAKVEETKADREEVDKLSDKVQRLQWFVAIGIGLVMAVQFYYSYLKK